jgi:hypothetical protein
MADHLWQKGQSDKSGSGVLLATIRGTTITNVTMKAM